MNFPMIFCNWGNDELESEYKFHQFILEDTGWTAFGTAVAIGIVIAVIYYLIVGKNSRMANLYTWVIALIASLAMSYIVADKVFVGEPQSNKKGVNGESITYKYSFFHAIDKREHELTQSDDSKYKNNPAGKKKIREYKLNLKKKIKRGQDMVMSYNMCCGLWTLIFFILTSYVVKNWQAATSTVPTYWPSKSVR